MTTTVTGKHMDVGDSLRKYAVDKVQEVCSKYLGETAETHIIVSKSHHLFSVDLDMHLGHNLNVHCRTQNEDAYQAVDAAINKMTSRLKRYTGRLHTKKREKLRDIETTIVHQYIVENKQEDVGEDVPAVIAQTATVLSTITVSEAVMMMDLQELPVLIFRNAASKHINVLYRRNDGHITWVDPKQD